mmetsp:Transcript_14833/g.32313  ORF Transcript_14833/g.32313 Transcript_14833/m.32313 type:complete len:324 (-) Transcript_14833:183-1154(-)
MEYTLNNSFRPTDDDCVNEKHAALVDSGEIVCVVEPVVDQDTYGHIVHDVEASEAVVNYEDQVNEEEEDGSIPYAVASALTEPLLSPASLYFVESGEARALTERETSNPLDQERRPEFLYASAIKPTPDAPAGISFRKVDGFVVISHIKPNGLFKGSGLQAGDRVIAINNNNCMDSHLSRVSKMIAKSQSTVSVCVWNKHGEPHMVSSSVQKPSLDSKLGISFQMRNGALTVSKVKVDGIFSGSLLMPDHRCFLINDQPCETLDSHSARDMTSSFERVTIVSRARGNLATVLSVGTNEVRRWSAVAVGAATAAAALTAFNSIS